MKRKVILETWAENLSLDLKNLRAIAEGEPDSKLSPELNASVPRLIQRKWLQACGCSDGDYVRLTNKGRAILQKDNPAP